MARNEMTELNIQLQELLDKGVHLTQLFSVWLPCYLCVEKGQDTTFVRRLPITQCGNRKEQVSNASY
jgi:hypothetical protein